MAQNHRHLSNQNPILAPRCNDFRFGSILKKVSRKPIQCDDSLSRPKQRCIAPAQKSIRNRRFVREQKALSGTDLVPAQEQCYFQKKKRFAMRTYEFCVSLSPAIIAFYIKQSISLQLCKQLVLAILTDPFITTGNKRFSHSQL